MDTAGYQSCTARIRKRLEEERMLEEAQKRGERRVRQKEAQEKWMERREENIMQELAAGLSSLAVADEIAEQEEDEDEDG